MFSEGMRFRHCLVRHVSCSLTRLRISLNMFFHCFLSFDMFLLVYVVFSTCALNKEGILPLLSIDHSKKPLLISQFPITIAEWRVYPGLSICQPN